MASDVFLRAAGIGAACGLRTFSGPVAAVATSGNEWTPLVGLLAIGELVFDKLPFTPARTGPIGLCARFVAGALCGASLASREDESPAIGALCGASTAIASAYAGYSIRRSLTTDGGWPDLPVALAEDAVALWTAFSAAG